MYLALSDYTPASATTDTGAAAAGAASSSDGCKDDDNRWEWKCLIKAEKVLLIFIIILLFVAAALFVFCVVWYCVYRPREKIEPEDAKRRASVDNEATVTPSTAENTYSERKPTNGIPYEYEYATMGVRN